MERIGYPPHIRDAIRARERLADILGQVRRPAFGRYAPAYVFNEVGMDSRPFRVDLSAVGHSKVAFRDAVSEVLSRRFYQPETTRKYLSCLDAFLAWLKVTPARVHAKVIGCYLMELKNNGARPATLRLHLSVLRTTFDKLCGRRVTDEFYLARIAPCRSTEAVWLDADASGSSV